LQKLENKLSYIIFNKKIPLVYFSKISSPHVKVKFAVFANSLPQHENAVILEI